MQGCVTSLASRREFHQLYYLKNIDTLKEKRKRYYIKNRHHLYEHSKQQQHKKQETVHLYNKDYYARNKDLIKLQRHSYYQAKKAIIKQYRQQEERATALKEYKRQYDLQNKDRLKTYQAQYQARNGDLLKERRRVAHLRNRLPLKKYWIVRTRPNSISKSWKDPLEVRKFLESVKEKLHISSPEDWYRVSRVQLKQVGGIIFWFILSDRLGGGLYNNIDTLYHALALAYPETDWHLRPFTLRGKKSTQRCLTIKLEKILP
jgi:hypothetical protein